MPIMRNKTKKTGNLSDSGRALREQGTKKTPVIKPEPGAGNRT